MTCHDAVKLAQGKGLQRHVAELNRLCDGATIVSIVERSRTRIATRLHHARDEVQVNVARSTTF